MISRNILAATLTAAAITLAGCHSSSSNDSSPTVNANTEPQTACTPTTTFSEAAPPPIEHVFVIVLENKSFEEVYGAASVAEYLRGTVVPTGQLLTQFYGTSHASTGNYISMLGGQAPNPASHGDCAIFAQWTPFNPVQPVLDFGQANGAGCLYPNNFPTLVDEMDLHNLIFNTQLSWRGWMEDMELELEGEARANGRPADNTCVGPALNELDGTNGSDTREQYAARHNPFLFYRSIIGQAETAEEFQRCDNNVIDLRVGSPAQQLPGLKVALQSRATTPNYNLIVPDNCHNAHDSATQCEGTSGGPGGLLEADRFLNEWVPPIVNSPAFREAGMLVILFDEANFGQGDPQEDYAACCGQELQGGLKHRGADPGLNGLLGAGGGRFGAVVLSPFTQAGQENDTPYNHYSMLRTIENLFGLNKIHFDPTDGVSVQERMAQLRSADAGTRQAAIDALTPEPDTQPYIGYAGLPPSEGMVAFGGDVYNCQPAQ
ncbi:MAG TPA: hypothetical protein DIW43_07235 [Spongiibacteraceae bacterium]|nr:hypothetical protein [Spongiibacteraceae bacterium]HCS27230.1 hypothetical protein [Spongiibacteraceae bacterium]